MLLRNTNPREGPCNGTRMIFDTTINNKLLRCTIAGTAKQVLIPRITFRPKEDNSPFSGAGASSPSQLHSPPQSTRPKDRLSSSSEYCCANLSAATASSMWLRPGLGPRPNSSSPSNLNHQTHQIRQITLFTERSCCRTDTARRGRQRPLRVLWTPCHVSVIPAFFLLIITAGNNYVSHTCHISNMCCSPTRPNAVFILVYMSFVSIRYYKAVLYAALHSYNLFVTWQHTSDYTLTGITYIHIYNNITYIYTGCM